MSRRYAFGMLVPATCVAIFLSLFVYDARRETFEGRSMIVRGEVYQYRVYGPPRRNTAEKLPVILFLHGAGERGDDNMIQTRVGLGSYLAKNDIHAVIVLPQCREGKWWTDPDMEEMALGALDDAIRSLNGDEKRIYLTGISMGGYGIYSIAAHNPGKFAAIVPICGGIKSVKIKWRDLTVPAVSAVSDPYAAIARKITCPVWTFHAADDDVIPVAEQRNMARALRAAGKNVRETEYEAGRRMGHHVWGEVYSNPELWTWLFSQHK